MQNSSNSTNLRIIFKKSIFSRNRKGFKMIDKIIDYINKNGNDFLDNIIRPIAKGTLQYGVNDTKVAQYLLTIKTALMENKISQFLKYIEEEKNNSILDFINNLSENEKVFFIETVSKIMDMDDSLQIYILSQLTKAFKKNGKLNYWENHFTII